MVELIEVGRRTGGPHSSMFLVPLIEGDAMVMVASKGGDQRDPDWLKNFLVHPDVEVVTRGERRSMVARMASSEERAVLWPRVASSSRGYQNCQRRANREIPLVLCVPSDR